MELYGYEDVGGKHEENIYTKWFQNYYLFEKFGIDKRKAFYSSLINAGQMTRKEALDLLQRCPVYPALGIEKKAMSYERHSHDDYPKDERLFNFISNIIKLCRRINGIIGGHRH